MTDQPVNGQPFPPPPSPPDVTTEPLTSVQSQIGLLLTAVATLIAFVFHKDFSTVVPAVTTLAFAVYGAAVAISRAIKHRTVVQAQVALHDQQLGLWADRREVAPREQIQAAFNAVADHMGAIEAKVNELQAAKKPPQKAASAPTRARKSTGTRRRSTTR